MFCLVAEETEEHEVFFSFFILFRDCTSCPMITSLANLGFAIDDAFCDDRCLFGCLFDYLILFYDLLIA